MSRNSEAYFENRDCAYFPCHQGSGEEFNCLFCYCPLYALGDRCGGSFRYLENGIKDCSACLIPHKKSGYDYVQSKFLEIAALAEKNQTRGQKNNE